MDSLQFSLPVLARQVWAIIKRDWKVLVPVSGIPTLLFVLDRWVFSGPIGSIVVLTTFVTSILAYIFYVLWVVDVFDSGKQPLLRDVWRRMTLGRLWRVLRAHAWMIVVIVWPAVALIALSGVLGFWIGDSSFSGTTISLIAMGIAAVIGVIVAFIRTLSFAGMSYLSLATKVPILRLQRVSKSMMRGARIKLFKIVIPVLVLWVLGIYSVVLMPIVYMGVSIIMTIFMIKVHELSNNSHRHSREDGNPE